MNPEWGWRSPARAARRVLSAGAHLIGRPELGFALPDFVLIGAMKAGTTSFFAALARHPGIVRPRRREIHYFSQQYARGFSWYQRHFPTRYELRERLTGEGSVTYLSDPAVPGRMYRVLPKVRLIAVLRNPVARAISHYFHQVKMGRETLPIEAAFAAEEGRMRQQPPTSPAGPHNLGYRFTSCYAEHLVHFLEVFPRDHLLVLQSEAFFADPVPVLNQAFRFLGLPTGAGSPDIQARNLGQYDRTRVPPDLLRSLHDYFAPRNEELYRLMEPDWRWPE